MIEIGKTYTTAISPGYFSEVTVHSTFEFQGRAYYVCYHRDNFGEAHFLVRLANHLHPENSNSR